MSGLSTLFIPDISGFTRFVHQTEKEHSRHIIGELISLIIEEGSPWFRVAEVEGDAVFFYHREEAFTIDRILEVARHIYRRFHRHLDLYEHRRICSCGACSQAVNLRLKFIAHLGEVELIEVNGAEKPFGTAVIEVHRLLKNGVDSDEYVLFSRGFGNPSVVRFDGSGQYEDETLGTIPYNYSLIRDWKMPPEEWLLQEEAEGSDIIAEGRRTFALPAAELHEMVINLDYRHLWVDYIDRLEYDHDRMNQVNTRHLCIVRGRELEFTTIRPKAGQELLTYGEVLKNPEPFTYAEMNIFLEPTGEAETRVTVRLKVNLPWYLRLLSPLFRAGVNRRIRKILGNMGRGIESFRALHTAS